MFAEHFGVRENPFYSLSDPDAIFPSSELREAVQHFLFARENRDAIFLLTGEVGTGKTTAIRAVCRELPQDAPIATLYYSTLGPDELLKELVIAFRLKKRTRESRSQRFRRLETAFRDFVQAGSLPLLIFDEAHLLDDAVLEEIRLLTNLRHEGHPLLQVCLVGQAELAARLRQPSLRPLRQRISVRYAMRPLGLEETGVYLIERARAVGSDTPHLLFNEAASRAIHELSGGIPREINVVASQAMLNAYIDGVRVVHEEHVRSVREDYGFEGVVPPPPPKEDADVSEEEDGLSTPTSTVSPEKSETEIAVEVTRVELAPPELDALATTVPVEITETAKPSVARSDVMRAVATVAVAALFAVALLFVANRSNERILVTTPEPGLTGTLHSPPEETVSAKTEPLAGVVPPTTEGGPTTTTPRVVAELEKKPIPAEPDLRIADSRASAAIPGSLAERFPSTLEVRSVLPAVAWLDNERLGMAPGRFAPVAPGHYQLKLDAGDGRMFEQNVVVTPGSTTYVHANSYSQ